MSIVAVKMKEIALAMIIGQSFIANPYESHKNIPVVRIRYIASDKSFVCLVFRTVITCGINETVVQVAAISPIIVVVIFTLFS